MTPHTMTTRFSPVRVLLHGCELGWLPVVVGQHAVPSVPSIDPRTAPSEQAALRQPADAISGLESY